MRTIGTAVAASRLAEADAADREDAPWHERTRFEAEYELECPARCASCEATLTRIAVVRMMRVRVNFTSMLPRHGHLLVCPHCRTALPAELRGVV